MAISLYDIYINGLLRDFYLAEAAQPPPVNRFHYLMELQKKLTAKIIGMPRGERIKNLYVVVSPTVTAEHTKNTVRGAHPPCGASTPRIDEQAEEYIKAITAAGAGLAAIPGVGMVAIAVAGIVAYVVGMQNTYQAEASCVYSTVLVPACLSLDDLNVRAWVGESQNPLLNAERDPRNDGWAEWIHVDYPYLSEEVISLRLSNTESTICKFRLLVLGMRNWSHNRNIQFYFKAYWDAPTRNPCECLDFSLVSDLYKETLMSTFMDPDLLGRYVHEYAEESK